MLRAGQTHLLALRGKPSAVSSIVVFSLRGVVFTLTGWRRRSSKPVPQALSKLPRFHEVARNTFFLAHKLQSPFIELRKQSEFRAAQLQASTFKGGQSTGPHAQSDLHIHARQS